MSRRRRRLGGSNPYPPFPPAATTDWSDYVGSVSWANYDSAEDLAPSTIASGLPSNIGGVYTNLKIANIAIDDTRFLAVYQGASYYIYARIGQIDSAGAITYGTAVTIYNSTTNTRNVSATLLDSTHAAIALNIDGVVNVLAIEFSGTTISTVGTADTFDIYASECLTITAISSSEVLIYYRQNASGGDVYVYYASISGTTTTVGNSYNLGDGADIIDGTIIACGGGKAILVFTRGLTLSTTQLEAQLISVNGTTPQLDDTLILETGDVVNLKLSGCKVDNNKVIIITYEGVSNKTNSYVIVNNSGTLSCGNKLTIASVDNLNSTITCVNPMYAVYSYIINNTSLHGGVIHIDGTTLTLLSNDTQLSGVPRDAQICSLGQDFAAVAYINHTTNTDDVIIMPSNARQELTSYIPTSNWPAYTSTNDLSPSQFVSAFPTTPSAGSSGRLISLVRIDSTRMLMVYRGVSAYTYARIAQIDSAGTITYGTAVTIQSATQLDICACLLDSTHAVIGLQSTNTVQLVALDFSGTTIGTVGTITTVESSASTKMSIAAISSSEVLLYYRTTGGGGVAKIYYASISGTTVTVGNSLSLGAISTYSDGFITGIGNGKAIVAYQKTTAFTGEAQLISVSGTTPQSDYTYTFLAGTNIVSVLRGVKIEDNKLLLIWSNSSAAKTQAIVIVNTAGVLSSGTLSYIHNAASECLSITLINTTFALAAVQINNVAIYSKLIYINGTNLTWATTTTNATGDKEYCTVEKFDENFSGLAYEDDDSADGRFIIQHSYNPYNLIQSVKLDDYKTIFIYRSTGAGTYARIVETDAYGTVSVGNEYLITEKDTNDISAYYISKTKAILVVNSGIDITLILINISGTIVSVTNSTVIDSVIAENLEIIEIKKNQFLVSFIVSTALSIYYVTVSGNNITVENSLNYTDITYSYASDFIGGGYAIGVRAFNDTTQSYGEGILIQIAGDTPNVISTTGAFLTGYTLDNFTCQAVKENFVIAAWSNNNDNAGQVCLIQNDNSTLVMSGIVNFTGALPDYISISVQNQTYAIINYSYNNSELRTVILTLDTENLAVSVDTDVVYGSFENTQCDNIPALESIALAGFRNSDASGQGQVISLPNIISPFSPLSINGAILWLDASDSATITESSGYVSNWADKSGNSNDASQATGANQPYYSSNIIGGKPAIQMDGANTYLKIGTQFLQSLSTANNGITIILVSQCNVIQVSSIFVEDPTTSNPRFNCHLPWEDGTLYWDYGNISAGGRVSGSWDASTGVPYIWILNSNGSTSQQVYQNGSLLINGLSGDLPNYSSSYQVDLGGNPGYIYNGDIAEMLVYNRQLSSDENALINKYLSKKYNITL